MTWLESFREHLNATNHDKDRSHLFEIIRILRGNEEVGKTFDTIHTIYTNQGLSWKFRLIDGKTYEIEIKEVVP